MGSTFNEIGRMMARSLERAKRRGHHCFDWDLMWVTEDDPEFESCLCFKRGRQ